MYQYHGEVLRVIDGDTLLIGIDLGFNINHINRFRLAGIDAPPITTPEGIAAKVALQELVHHASGRFFFDTKKDRRDKYGRYLVSLYYTFIDLQNDTNSVNQWMVANGYAVKYPR